MQMMDIEIEPGIIILINCRFIWEMGQGRTELRSLTLFSRPDGWTVDDDDDDGLTIRSLCWPYRHCEAL